MAKRRRTTEGYRFTYSDDWPHSVPYESEAVQEGERSLRGRLGDLALIESALTEHEWSLGQAELLYGVYYLHVTVKTEV